MDSCPQVDLTYSDSGCPGREHFEQPVVVCSGAAVEESAGAAVVLATAEVNVSPIQPGWPQLSKKHNMQCTYIYSKTTMKEKHVEGHLVEPTSTE